MSQAKEKEKFPFMDEPIASPAIELGCRIPQTSDPKLEPPPNSNVVGSQSQDYTALPPASSNPPNPVMQPLHQQQENSQYLNSATIQNGNSHFGNVYNPAMSVPQMYYPMESEVPMLTPGPIIVPNSQTRNSRRRKRICLTVSAVVAVIILAFAVGFGIWARLHGWDIDLEMKKFQLKVEGNRFVSSKTYSSVQTFKNYEDYKFDRLNKATFALVKTLNKSEKLVHEESR